MNSILSRANVRAFPMKNMPLYSITILFGFMLAAQLQAQQIPEEPPEQWSVSIRIYGTTDQPERDHFEISIKTNGTLPADVFARRPAFYDKLNVAPKAAEYKQKLTEEMKAKIYSSIRSLIHNHRIDKESKPRVEDGDSVEVTLAAFDKKISVVFHRSSTANEFRALIEVLDSFLPKDFFPKLNGEAEEFEKRKMILEFPTAGGTGAGFVGKKNGQFFAVTNLHVLAAVTEQRARSLSGTDVSLSDTVYVIGSRDIALIPIEWTGPSLPLISGKSESQPKVGDDVLAWLREPDSSIFASKGKRLDGRKNWRSNAFDAKSFKHIADNYVEISNAYKAGNSGSPIIFSRTGEVFAIVAIIPANRYFAARMDFRETELAQVSWKQIKEIGALERSVQDSMSLHDSALRVIMHASYLTQLSGHDAEAQVKKLLASYGLYKNDQVLRDNANGLQAIIKDYSKCIAEAEAASKKAPSIGYLKDNLNGWIKNAKLNLATHQEEIEAGRTAVEIPPKKQ